jgi:hypothetical protein
MHATRVKRAAALPLVAVIAAIVLLASGGAGSAAVAQLPFTVTNNSGRGDATYIYVIARNSAGAQGYVDAGGAWHAWSFPSSTPNGPVAAPDVSIPGPGNGASKTITLPPSLAGGRIYLSMGSKLSFFLTTNGLVEPAPWVASDANANVLYDWTEFARASTGGNGIFINTTTVDMFSIPLTVSVTSSAGATQTQGIPGNRSGILSAFSALGAPWSSLITTRASDGLQLRVLAPVHGIANGSFSSTYLDAYITAVWSYYATHTLTVQTSLGNFTGRTSGNNWAFTSSTGAVIGTLTKPNTSDTFACAGGTQPQGQPNETAILAVGARVCAALNRATLSTSSRVMFDTQPTTDASQFYGQSASNLFSKTIHANSLNGLAYGFSYDDVGGFAPVIDQPDPASAGMTIGSFGTSGGTGGTGGGTITGNTITGPGGKCIDVAGNDTGGNNAAVQIWDCQATAVDQHWTYTSNTLRTLGRCMDVAGGLTANGTKVQLYDCNSSGAQVWQARADGTLFNPQSGRCLDDPNGTTTNGTQLQIYDCNTSAAQKWTSASFPTSGGTSATSTIQAESFSAQSGTTNETTTDTGGGQDVAFIANGDWLQYNNVNFGTAGLHTFSARVASGAAAGVSGTVEVHLDSLTNPVIGSFSLANTGGWQTWKTTPAAISATTGTHTVYLKFVSGQSADFVNVNWFTFS